MIIKILFIQIVSKFFCRGKWGVNTNPWEDEAAWPNKCNCDIGWLVRLPGRTFSGCYRSDQPKCCVYFFKIRLGLKILAPSRKVLEREIFQSGVGAPMLIFCYLICELRSIFWLGIIWNLEKEIKLDFGVGLAWSWYNCKQFNFNIKLFCCIMFST